MAKDDERDAESDGGAKGSEDAEASEDAKESEDTETSEDAKGSKDTDASEDAKASEETETSEDAKASADAGDSDDDDDDDDEGEDAASSEDADAASSEDADAEKEDDAATEAAAPGGDGSKPPPPLVHKDDREPASWGKPFARVDELWTKWEAWLCAAVLLLEVVVLSLWVGLKGLSTPPDVGSVAGIVFRGMTGALVLGLGGFLLVHKKGKPVQRVVSITGVAIGVFTAKAWGAVGVEWSSNLLNWFQQASVLTLLGGLRGVGTRLTLLLALLGGSLATASGKHITIDLITRFLKPKARMPVVLAGWVGSAVICASAGWGFFDHIAIEDFGAKADATPSEKVSEVKKGIGEAWFIARKQIALDVKTLPKVLKGDRYAEWLGGDEWNAWLDSSGYVERYGREKTDQLKMSADIKRSPIVVVPEKGEPRGELIKPANLVFPFGLWIMAIRFLLLCILTLSGHMKIDPEAHIEGSDISRKRGEGDQDVLDDAKPAKEDA